jgi:hypothetical protein
MEDKTLVYDNTHKNNFLVPKLPWHTDDHKFGEETPDAPQSKRCPDGTLRYCHCGLRGEVWDGKRWYCFECYDNGDNGDEEE